MRIHLLTGILALLLFNASSCDGDKYVPVCDGSHPTYDSLIKPIIDLSCARNSGCHGAGSGNGVYTSYSGMQEIINNGKFESEVINRQTMPKGGTLTTSQLDLIQCWVDDGYPEN